MIAPAVFASTAIILLSFVSEDAATISSALSIFGGPVSWPLGFAACFIGIWLGDLGLYALARCLGRPILQRQWVARFADATAIERCQEKFNQRGSLTLLVSRFVPGTRLPTYLAAGLLSMPPVRFALITALAALLWIGGIFAITKLLGSQTLIWFSFFHGKIAAIVLTTLLLSITLFAFRKLALATVAGVVDPGHATVSAIENSRGQRPRLQPPAFVRRWMRWEFWPSWLFYVPWALITSGWQVAIAVSACRLRQTLGWLPADSSANRSWKFSTNFAAAVVNSWLRRSCWMEKQPPIVCFVCTGCVANTKSRCHLFSNQTLASAAMA